ncbi:acyl-CoA carboxylase subunit beta [Parablautia sp. Marseille-Q6255]|uniref:acyl-CoA carboxylase subunit beta n=1 Tax=Parablautia sp. Marseille-Q6255 TaxID=3039593 RepID=UPI0024BC0BB4|nr:carboxyl transferase domain-containing protein [Parablautia sp. Marseille-Q6255]
MSNTAQSLAGKRIASLLDENSFVEIGGYVTARSTDFNMQQTETPGDGVITGYGVIDGNLVYVYSQDASVLGGTIGEMHAKKIAGLYDMAMKMGAPVIGLLDCAGLRLQEATDALNAFGEIYMKQTLASGVIPQISAVFGTCGGGLALVPALTDFTFMEGKKAELFVNSPNALDGNTKEKCNTAAAAFQSEEAGLVDFVGTEDEILAGIRELVTMLPANNEDDMSYEECTDDLNRVCADLANAAGDTSILISNIADDNNFVEVKAAYAPDMVTGFIRLNGTTVGVVANRTEIYDEEGALKESFESVLSARGAEKAAQFVTFCDAFEIPVLTLTNVTGFKASKCSEKKIAKAVAKLTYAFANATVPKVNVIIGKAFGSAYVAMNSKAIGADMTFAWSQAQIGMMDAQLAAKIMYADADAKVINEKAAEYAALQSSAAAAARRGYVDNIIEAEDTRKYVIGAFEMLFTKRDDRPSKKHGTV